MKFHQQNTQQLLQSTQSREIGLSQNEVNERQLQFGLNQLKTKNKKPIWLLFLSQFKDFMILILMVAAILSGIMGDSTDTLIILVIVFLNALIGFFQEYRAGKALDALKKLAGTSALVIRSGHQQIIDSIELVPGDLVELESGNQVPADIRLIEVHSLLVDESSLTGESIPVEKHNQLIEEEEIPLGDQSNMVFKGTLVTNGRAKGIVVATGMETELGKIAGLLEEEEPETPLQRKMDEFGKKLTYLVLIICVILFVSGWLRGEEPFQLLLLSISLAVAAIPEALPALITIALSRGAARLAKKNALIRKLPAVETLGSVSFICSDKTGTLTLNQMQVTCYEYWPDYKENSLSEKSDLGLAMCLNQDSRFDQEGKLIAEATEMALVKKGMELCTKPLEQVIGKFPRIAELPFDSDRKRMSTLHQHPEGILVITKGASESIATILKSEEERDYLLKTSAFWAKKGLRVLAYSYVWQDDAAVENAEQEQHLIGLVGLIDPARPEVAQSIKDCKTAGIIPVMITGDHPDTAASIAREIGILGEGHRVLSGQELQAMGEDKLEKNIEDIRVYARVSPEQKLKIIKAIRNRGHYVAMTGDGVNDAPSLKASNIGVAMGINGTDVSKEAAHLILLDDHFATIIKAVKEGRRIFDNIRKFVKYMMTCNGAEIWTIFLAPFLGMPMPLLPIHILWINLVTDGLPALALASEKAEDDILHRPPRPQNESLFSHGVGFHIVWVGLLMAGLTLGTQYWSLNKGLEHWQTMVFTVLSMAQIGHVLAIRSERTFLFKQGFSGNLPLLGAVLITVGLQLSVIYLPFMNTIFKTQPLSVEELAISFGAAAVLFHAVEFEKFIRRIRERRAAN